MRILMKIRILLMVLLVSCAGSCFANFDSGYRFYVEKDYEKAYREFLASAKLGDFDAQHNLAVMYYRGEYISKDKITAYAWFKLAAQMPAYAKEAIGEKIFARFSDEEKQKAKEKFDELNKLYGENKIKMVLVPGIKVCADNSVRDRHKIKSGVLRYPMLMEVFEQPGFVDLSYTIDKQGFTRDFVVNQSPSDIFSESAIAALKQNQYEPHKVNGKAVDIHGYRTFMTFVMQGARISEDAKITASLIKLKKKAAEGDGNDKLNYAYFLDAIPKISRTYLAADNPQLIYKQAAKSGSAAAGYFLAVGSMFGCKQNEALHWLMESATQGFPEAQYMLALESFNGIEFAKDINTGINWLEKSAKQSDIAKLRLSWILATSSDEQLLDPERARSLLDAINPRTINDDLNYYQTQAAVFAREGNFKKAKKWQAKAIREAKSLKLPLGSFSQKLESYKNNKPWVEEI